MNKNPNRATTAPEAPPILLEGTAPPVNCVGVDEDVAVGVEFVGIVVLAQGPREL